MTECKVGREDLNDPINRWVVSTVRIELVRNDIVVLCPSADEAVEIALRTDPRYLDQPTVKDENTEVEVLGFAIDGVKLKMISVEDEVSQ